jgi:hypothetical protein
MIGRRRAYGRSDRPMEGPRRTDPTVKCRGAPGFPDRSSLAVPPSNGGINSALRHSAPKRETLFVVAHPIWQISNSASSQNSTSRPASRPCCSQSSRARTLICCLSVLLRRVIVTRHGSALLPYEYAVPGALTVYLAYLSKFLKPVKDLAMAMLLGGVPAAVCSWLSDKSMRSQNA